MFPFLFHLYLNIGEESVHTNAVSLFLFLSHMMLTDKYIDPGNKKRMLIHVAKVI